MPLFLLSPALTTGKRAALLLRAAASFPLALRLRAGRATLAEVFSFLSGLYFRGKVAYAHAFSTAAAPPRIITSSRGLLPFDTRVTAALLDEFSATQISVDSPQYASALTRSSRALLKQIPKDTTIVLLGSIAERKYIVLLVPVFGDRLLAPLDFSGRGDMSRGSMLLKAARAGDELLYCKASRFLKPRCKRPNYRRSASQSEGSQSLYTRPRKTNRS